MNMIRGVAFFHRVMEVISAAYSVEIQLYVIIVLS